MTDEQRPWREWPEWMLISPTYDVQKDALCARAWREALIAAEAIRDAMLDNADDREQAERTRADAAEAQRDRLATALRKLDEVMDFDNPAERGDRGIVDPTALNVAMADARAALADVRDVPPAELMPLLEQAVCDKQEKRGQYAMTPEELAEKLSSEADLVPWPDSANATITQGEGESHADSTLSGKPLTTDSGEA